MNILREAEETSLAREKEYGPPERDFKCIMQIWNALLDKAGGEVSPELVPLFMIGVKLSRLAESPDHRDSMVDIAGYARALEILTDVGDLPPLSPLSSA